jgi:AraC family transcriptional regulator of adaptative response/methylated-DNA-[protein]-cysteine methyltransferase
MAAPATASDDPRWHLVARRASTTEFVYAVRTTGIVCRVGCASRRPRPENVEFFDDVEDAVRAGFRPCRRCRPDAQDPQAAFVADIAQRARAMRAGGADMAETARCLHVSERHLRRILRVAQTLADTPADTGEAS